MTTLKKLCLLNFLILVLVGISCSKEEDPIEENSEPIITEVGQPTGPVEEFIIGTEGGVVNSSDGLLSIKIPQGSLSSVTTISVQPITNTAPLGTGQGFKLGPEGIGFNVPVELTFNYTDEMLESSPAELLWIVFQEADGSWKALLDSEVDTMAKTLKAETKHFSTWATGRFMDLTLSPLSKILQKGESVDLKITGFQGMTDLGLEEIAGEDNLAPLMPAFGPPKLMPYRYTDVNEIRIDEWRLNNELAPVTNSYGTLETGSDDSPYDRQRAKYTAPSTITTSNTAKITVLLSAAHETGVTRYFKLLSVLTIVQNKTYLEIEFLGEKYTYYQFGIEESDPDNVSITTCHYSDGLLEIGAGTYTELGMENGFTLSFADPKKGTSGLIGSSDEGDDQMSFYTTNPLGAYDLLNITRTQTETICENEWDETDNVNLTLSQFELKDNTEIIGSFLGTLYSEGADDNSDCISRSSHQISGNFRLQMFIIPDDAEE